MWVSETGLIPTRCDIPIAVEQHAEGVQVRINATFAQDIKGSPFSLTIQTPAGSHGPYQCSGKAAAVRARGKRVADVRVMVASLAVLAVFGGLGWYLLGRAGGPDSWSREQAESEVRAILAEPAAATDRLLGLGSNLLQTTHQDLGIVLLRAAADRGDPAGWLALGRHYDPRLAALGSADRPRVGRANLALHHYGLAVAAGAARAADEKAALTAWLEERARQGDMDAETVLQNAQ